MIAVLGFGLYTLYNTIVDNVPLVGRRAPAFSTTSLDGSSDFIYDIPEDGTYLIVVINGGCHFCESMVPFLNQLYGNDDFHVLGVSTSNQEETARFMMDNHVQFPVSLVSQDFDDSYRYTGTPTSFLIHNGIIEKIYTGKPTPEEMSYLLSLKTQGAL